ncbi:Hypothetical_protein [Hexamita inflata]|uniref:Hypothetical_protein n=1 Tax=Hexamita inflata TaxID=28002 RepID=A0AA86NFM5_9EUKA|nr:Hypothetical protein HINF_LOCUS5811 [Hexamita inflata]
MYLIKIFLQLRRSHHQSINRTTASRWSAGLARRSAELRLRQRRLATLEVQGPLDLLLLGEMEWETWSVVTKSSQNMLNESIYFCILLIVTGQADPTSSNNTVKPVNHPLEAHHHNEDDYACIVLLSDCVMENKSSTIDQMSCLILTKQTSLTNYSISKQIGQTLDISYTGMHGVINSTANMILSANATTQTILVEFTVQTDQQ